jgi:hypothetical protein
VHAVSLSLLCPASATPRGQRLSQSTPINSAGSVVPALLPKRRAAQEPFDHTREGARRAYRATLRIDLRGAMAEGLQAIAASPSRMSERRTAGLVEGDFRQASHVRHRGCECEELQPSSESAYR